MSKFKYLWLVDRDRLMRVMRGVTGLSDALDATQPATYAEALDPTRDDRILRLLSAEHIANEYQNISKINRVLPYIKPGTRILDFGGGDGLIASALTDRGTVWVVDQHQRAMPRGIHYQSVTDAEFATGGLGFSDGFFDVVLCFMVLHHIKNPTQYIAELTRCTKKYLIIHEHDCQTIADKYLLDVVHGLYQVRKAHDYDQRLFSQAVIWYRTKQYFNAALSRKFRLVRRWTTNATTGNYMQVWRKL